MSKFDLDKYLKDLEELVNHESFTHDFENLNKTADYLVKKYKDAGLYVDVEYQGEEKLAHIVASTVDPKEVAGEEKPYDIMFIGHYDTVLHRWRQGQRTRRSRHESRRPAGILSDAGAQRKIS